jgi:iron complex transport system substrate-binding protein
MLTLTILHVPGVGVLIFRLRQSLLWIVAATSIAACDRTADVAGDVVDDFGRRVALTEPAQRVVSLSPAITELLFAIGAGTRVVGRTQFDKYPPAVAEIPDVGDGLDPNIERVVARRPDLVVFYASNANERAIGRLTDIGIASVSIRLDSLNSVARGARLLGSLTGTAQRAESVARDFETRRDSALRAPRPALTARVLILAWDNPPIIIGARSFLSELVELAGGENVFADVDAPSATVAVETIAERDPDVIVFFAEDAPTFAERPEWQTIPAARGRKFVFLEGSEFEYPSPRAFQALQTLRGALSEVVR